MSDSQSSEGQGRGKGREGGGTVTTDHVTKWEKGGVFFVYYAEIKPELKRILIYECRCNERLKTKTEGSTRLG